MLLPGYREHCWLIVRLCWGCFPAHLWPAGTPHPILSLCLLALMYDSCKKVEKKIPPGVCTAERPFSPFAPTVQQSWRMQSSPLPEDAGSRRLLIVLDSREGAGLLWPQESSIRAVWYSLCLLPSRSLCAYFFFNSLGIAKERRWDRHPSFGWLWVTWRQPTEQMGWGGFTKEKMVCS